MLNNPSIVFVVSQPRAGSTLLQTMLGGHPQVCEVGESWLMLRIVDVLAGSRRGTESRYDGELADEAIELFAQGFLDRGMTTIRAELGMAVRRIYQSVDRGNASVLIDKTPRYYWIIEDLLNLVPEAKVIVLRRNPLAVLTSIIRTWGLRRKAGFLSTWRSDLLEAPIRLANAAELRDERIMALSYEQLAHDPEPVLDRVQQFIGVNPVAGLSNYKHATQRQYGDPHGVHANVSVQGNSVNHWLDHVTECPADWRLVDDYRKLLGRRLLTRLGYDFDELAASLDRCRPRGSRLAPSLGCQLKVAREPAKSTIKLRRAVVDKMNLQRRVA